MPSDEEIRLLCARVVNARGTDFDKAIAELQAAIEARLTPGDKPKPGDTT